MVPMTPISYPATFPITNQQATQPQHQSTLTPSAHSSHSVHVAPAAREQPVQQHPAELGWSAAFESSVVASVALLQRDHLDGLDHPCWCCLAFVVVDLFFLTLLAPGW
ncbi:hypothetical protein F2Q69_00041176 [Brassica cretica]|uniref:Uncharacterized protein n=1 Tax=Brassica cretica TaxID=69181 RepID=A0A8S9NVS2_BRACR|nr:hypothetical protein F2Q69_00041176 [Brassica cretica]